MTPFPEGFVPPTCKPDCPCQEVGPVCDEWKGIGGETGRGCPECGWTREKHQEVRP